MNLPNMLEAKKRTDRKVEINYYEDIKEYSKIGVDKKYYIRTYGCQMNEHDSENIKAILESAMFTETSDMESADVIILNTCAIRENAHDKVFGFLGRIKHLKESRPEVVAGICGCMAQEENVVSEIKEKYKYINFVFGTHNLDKVLNYIDVCFKERNQTIEVYSCEGDIVENLPSKRENKYKAWVNIMLGCDKFCTYCIVPYTRGKQRSRRKEDILKEVQDLIKDGVKEITLLGQNVNAYGKDLYADYSLAELLLDISESGTERIRFVTSHPWDFTDEMVSIIKKCENVMPHVHLPVQSGSNRILKLMGRRYTKESYLELYNKLREIENMAITTDIIVGFPNESEEDFNETMDLVKECVFDGAFTFIYSPRENTPAAKMDDNISLEVKKERLYKLNEVINSHSNKMNNEYKNSIVKVLIEKKQNKDNIYMGYTENMKLVNVYSEEDVLGKVVDVKINEAKSFSLDGKIS